MKLQWDRVFSQYFGFSLSPSFHQCSTLIIILHLPEGQMSAGWKP
jgi:hypothetical protein